MFRNALIAAMLAFAGPALAQSTTTTPAEKQPEDEATMKEYAEASVKDIKASAAEVAKLTEAAKKDSDAGVLDCLTPRNVSMQALVQVAEGAQKKMLDALAAGDREQANHEYRKIQVARGKANDIKREANNCLAGEGGQGDKTVDVTGGVGDADDTSDRDDLDEFDLGFDPPLVSDFQLD